MCEIAVGSPRYIVLRGCRLGSLGKPTIMSATAGAGSLTMCAWQSGRRLLEVHHIGGLMGLLLWMNWKIGSRMKPKIISTFGDDTEFESEIKAIVDAQEPTFEVLATWKQTRTAMTQEKLRR